MERAAKQAFLLSAFDAATQKVEIVCDFLLREEAHELEAVAQLDLIHDGESPVAAERLEVVADGDAQALLGLRGGRELPLQRLQVIARVLPEDRDEEILL